MSPKILATVCSDPSGFSYLNTWVCPTRFYSVQVTVGKKSSQGEVQRLGEVKCGFDVAIKRGREIREGN